MKRIGIYFYFDNDGVLDEYAIYYLKEFKKIIDYLVVVINGFLDEKSIIKARQISDDLIIRNNVGFDVLAYKYAFNKIGWDRLSEYDELVYCNSTVFGPIYPFKNMFDKMSANVNLDFWGITSHPEYRSGEEYKIGYDILSQNNPYGYLPEHIQHYFVVYRKKFVLTNDLRNFWETIDNINTYVDSVSKFETVFTKYFEDKGYIWDTYIHFNSKEEGTKYLLLNKPDVAAIKYKVPIIKRKVFYIDKIHSDNKICERVSDLMLYLIKNKLYDINLITKNIERINSNDEYKAIIDAFNRKFYNMNEGK